MNDIPPHEQTSTLLTYKLDDCVLVMRGKIGSYSHCILHIHGLGANRALFFFHYEVNG